MEMDERIGFLGLGLMGSRMAAKLLGADMQLTVWTHTPGKASVWTREHGGDAVETPAEVASACGIVISMLGDGGDVASALLGEGGVADGASAGLLCVDMTTIGPPAARQIGAELGRRGLSMLDAPVSGSLPGADAGTLTIMVGGDAADFRRAQRVFEAMGELIAHVGELGQGQMTKVITNAIGAANAATVAEALLLVQESGLDLDTFLRVAGASAAASRQLDKAKAMSAHDYTPMFRTEHLLKDVRLCLAEAERAGIPFPSAVHARELLARAVASGFAAEDYASLIEVAASRPAPRRER
jgi:3-hydroxyisobutyrate dehydrogenase